MERGLKKEFLMDGGGIKMENFPDGWLADDAAKFLGELVAMTNGLTGDFLEIGSWHGRSSVVIGLEVKKLGGKLYCIDTWNTKSWDDIAKFLPKDRRKFIWEKLDKNPLKKFASNIKTARLENIITPLTGASEIFRKKWTTSLRFIFVDGCHYYDFVRDDTKWREFLIIGGIIAFHDYRSKRWKGVKVAIDEEMNTDNCFEEVGIVQSIKAFKRTGKRR